ncbi:hypothetical protein GGI11_008425, partial [Coemansia sp. RSA 2049]
MERELGELQTRRLPRARMAVVDSGVRTRRRATALCVGLQSTVDMICRTAWLVALVRGSRPEHPARKRRASRSGESEENEENEEKPNAAAGEASTTAAVPGRLAIADSASSSDSMADFIDDNDDDGSEEKQEKKGAAAAFVAEEQVVVNGAIGRSATPRDQIQNHDQHQDQDQDQETDQRLDQDQGQQTDQGMDQEEEQSPPSGSQKPAPHSRPATPDAQPEEKIATPRTRYARRSMAAKELDNELPGASLADSEQDKTLVTGRVQRKRKTKKAKKKETAKRQAAEVQMTQEELAQATSRHSAAQMYEAAVALIRRMAASGGLAEIKESGGSVDARIALRVWAEFQGWLAASSSDTNGNGNGGSVCARFADVGDALVRRTTGARPQAIADAREGAGDAPQPSPARFAAFWARRRAAAADGVCAPVLANPGRRAGSAARDAWIPGFLAWRLHEHQVAGVRFAWRAAIEGGDSGGDSGGCVLAHAMGLGKTLQAVALIYTLLSEVSAGAPALGRFASRRVLVLCPPTVQDNWVAEFARWTG